MQEWGLCCSYWSGIVDDTDRCYLGGTPHGLMDVLGFRSTEIDGLYDWEENQMVLDGKVTWIYGNSQEELKVYGLAVAKVE